MSLVNPNRPTLTSNNKPWSEHEIQLLRTIYPVSGAKEVVRVTGRALTAVMKKAQQLRVSGTRTRQGKTTTWTQEEIDTLKREYRITPIEKLSEALGRSAAAIYLRAHRLELKRELSWQADEVYLLRNLHTEKTTTELAVILGRPKNSIRTKLRAMGLQAKIDSAAIPFIKWSEQEIQQLRELATERSAPEVAITIGKSINATRKMAAKLGIGFTHRRSGYAGNWTDEELALLRAVYPSDDYNVVGEFSAQTGKTRAQIFQKARTLGLKRGTPPQNRGGRWRPLGSERNENGVIYRKISETGCPKTDWKRVCDIEWELQFGPIPSGMTIIPVKRGLPRHPSNMKLVRLEDIPVAAAYKNAPPEIARLFQLKAQLAKQLRRMEKHSLMQPQ